MVWIYGGGFTLGAKAGSGNPAGLIARSQDDGQEGVIYVAMNYRLGLFVSIVLETHVQILTLSGLAIGPNFPREWHCECWPLRPETCARMGATKHPSIWRRSRQSHCFW